MSMSFGGVVQAFQRVWNTWKVAMDPVDFRTSPLVPVVEKQSPQPLERALLEPPVEDSKTVTRDRSAKVIFSIEEVSLHNTADDCWIVVKDKVYDVTKFGVRHPGGPVIFTQAGRDATDTFANFHSPKTWKLLQEFHIGDIENADPVPEWISDYREMRMTFTRARLFKSSKVYYFIKCSSNLAILGASLAIIWAYQSYLAVFSSAFLLAVFWQQCGWLSHDFLHHQVLDKRWMNTAIGGFLFGNILQGFSTGWWKMKHNVHHAAPNECNKKYKPIDPDIDTIPLIAWSKEIVETIDEEVFKRIIRVQHIVFLPLLALARFSWLHSSWIHTNTIDMSPGTRILEKSTILLYYGWNICVGVWVLPLRMALIWLLFSQLFCGFLLSIVFVISHNGMEVYNDSRDFVNAQITSTRDVHGNIFNDWFTGGLNRQIEHHLFPSLPRHNLGKVAPFVKAFCKKHGLNYEDVSFSTGTYRVLARLAEVAAAA